MEIRIQETGQVVTEHEFRAYVKAKGLEEGKDIALPASLTVEIINDFGGDVVMEAPAPTVTDTQVSYRAGAVQDTLGNWVYGWAVRDLTVEEIEARAMETTRAFNADIDAQIVALESRVTSRRQREAILSGDTSFIAQIDAEIAALRAQRITV